MAGNEARNTMRGPGARAAPPGGAPPPTGPAGLTQAEAEARLRRYGPNRLPVAGAPPAWRHLLRQMASFFAVMLWIAGSLAFVIGIPALGAAIFIVVVVNGGFAFAQEHRAERAAARLRNLLPRRVTVIRDGRRIEIDAEALVIGDRVVLGTGDRISADLAVLEAHALQIDRSALTGESVPVAAEAGAPLLAGTFVTEGEGEAVVIAVGEATRLAEIARLTPPGKRPRTPLAREIHRVVRTMAVVAMGIGAVLFPLALLAGIPASDGFIFAVGVTVALVPEALLPTVTLSLALGAQRMARRNALVRRLESVETLGSATYICTDKTGTLTRGEMAVVEVWTPAGWSRIRGIGYEPRGDIEPETGEAERELRETAVMGVLCSTGMAVHRDREWKAQGDPMEAAIDVLARRLGIDTEAARNAEPKGRRFPFDPRRRRMSVVSGRRVLVKGAPDAVLPVCAETRGASEALHRMTGRGLRVLAVASRELLPGEIPTTADEAERGLRLLGLLGLEDPPREGVATSIAACRRAGIRVAMITGDHPATARAIAREVGLIAEDPSAVVVTGAELPDDDAELGEYMDRDGVVVSRVTPEAKLRIAVALRRRGHVVAVTGDGVNDGPALEAADIGVAMGRTGTDVAREAADLVLLDDDFSTIVAAIEHGRATFANVRRFLTYHLTDNVAEVTPFVVWALSAAQFPLALGVLQILALDIGTDTFSAVALGAEPPAKGTLDQPPPRGHILDRTVARRAFGVLGPVEAIMGLAAFMATFIAAGWRPGDPFPTGPVLLAASGATFAAVAIGQTANAFACRSAVRWPGYLGWYSNRLLVIAVVVELALVAVFLLPPAAPLLEHALPTAAGLAVAILAGPAVLGADALDKAIRRRRSLQRAPAT